MIIALAGNQNCGKTTLFNQLTGSNQHVGNFPGVTVERKEGKIDLARRDKEAINKHRRHMRRILHRTSKEEHKQDKHHGHHEHHEHHHMNNDIDLTLVDLPGIYSVSPYTSEEIVSRDFLISGGVDCIINIIDATNLERNLYLTMQLIELNIPMVIALNMMDEVRENGGSIDIGRLARHIGIPVVPISAIKNEGINELIDITLKTVLNKRLPERQDFCEGAVHRAIHSTAHLIEDHAQRVGVPSRFAATKIIEGDKPMIDLLHLSQNEKDLLEHTVLEMEHELDTDREAALADMRYTYIERLCSMTVEKKAGDSKEHIRSVRIDKVLTNKYLAIPMFLLIMFAIFILTFGVIGKVFQNVMNLGITCVSDAVGNMLTLWGVNPIVHSLVIDGIFNGLGSILSFLPTIIVLFFFLSILEDSGYMARVAFVMDKALRKIGLSGRSFVPMIIGFGCSVPAIMSARTLSSERDRKMTILLIPFMSCSAKLPVYSVITLAFFPDHAALVMIGLYILGIIIGIISAWILNKTSFKGKPVPFVMELPNYRMPGAKSVGMMMWDKAKDFLQRAFTVIFIATIIIWFLQNFDVRLNPVSNTSDSMLAAIGQFIQPVFAPLGFTDWRAPTALLAGFSAKEAVVSTLAVLTGSTSAGLAASLGQMFTPLAAGSFLIFTLLYTPCIAAITTIKNELKSTKTAVGVVIYQIAIAWVVSFLFYTIGSLIIA